jgi:predicted RNA-binding Zn-ribbon protein involved in translation (DUF1610 family)
MLENVHPSLTLDRVGAAVQKQMTTLREPGFCIACGGKVRDVEPEAEFYPCQACGERAVFSADQLLFHLTQAHPERI